MSKHSDSLHVCASIKRAANPLFDGKTKIYYGPDLEDTSEPEVLQLRRQGAHFYWVAVPLGSFSFWDLHVGAVVNPENLRVRLGIHCLASARAAYDAFESLKTFCRAQGLEAYYSPAAAESQYVSSERLADTPEAARDVAGDLFKLYDLASKSLRIV